MTVASLLVLSVAACGYSRSANSTPSQLETFALFYQQIQSASQLSRLGRVNVIVTVNQRDDKAAIRAIHARGAKAFLYVQSYWFPADETYDGVDISNHLGWAFCVNGARPLVGRVTDGRPWYILDANERAVQDYYLAFLRGLHKQGWDGVMMDRGAVALWGPYWHDRSSCTMDPVVRGARMSDAYVELMRDAHKAGLQLFMNYGDSPFDPVHPFRPDPRDPACLLRTKQARRSCRHLQDGFKWVNYFLDEGAAHPRNDRWAADFASNLANERAWPRVKVVGLLTQSGLGRDVSRSSVYFAYARVRLFDMPLAVFTGENRCHGHEALCDRQGVYTRLATAQFGRPLTSAPRSYDCTGGSRVLCLWVRQYSGGLVALNASGRAVPATLPLATSNCERVFSLYSRHLVNRGRCLRKVHLRIPPWSGRPMSYR
jgi:hypothetical protein